MGAVTPSGSAVPSPTPQPAPQPTTNTDKFNKAVAHAKTANGPQGGGASNQNPVQNVRRDIRDGNETALYSDLNSASKDHQINTVLSQLSRSELTSLDRLIDQPLPPSNNGQPATPDPQPGPPPPGFPMPGQDARNALFRSMAQGGASAANLAKLTKSLTNSGDAAGVAASVVDSGSSEFKLAYIQGLAPETVPPGFIGPIPIGATRAPASQTVPDPNSAVAIGNVLASLKGDPAAVNQAFGYLTDQQLTAVMHAATDPGSDNSVGLSAIINAGATGTDEVAKARVFALGAEANGDDGPALGALTKLLTANPQLMIATLEQHDSNAEGGVTPFGGPPTTWNQGLTSYVEAELGQGSKGTMQLARLFDQLKFGPAMTDGTFVNNPANNYQNARSLGYFVAAAQQAIANTHSTAGWSIVNDAVNIIDSIPYAGGTLGAGVSAWTQYETNQSQSQSTAQQDALYEAAAYGIADTGPDADARGVFDDGYKVVNPPNEPTPSF